jgi:hypothetical protein
MLSHDIEFTKIALVTVVLSVLLSVLALILFSVEPLYLPFKVGFISGLVGLIWFVYDKYLWKIPFFGMAGWLCSTPNLNGRWVGTVNREGENSPHEFVMEIYQTMSKMKFYTYSNNSNGESIVVKLVKDETGSKFKMIAYWSSRTKVIADATKSDQFNGLSVAGIHIDENEKRLSDFYFTDRTPHTRGGIELKWVSHKYYGSVDDKQVQN